MFLLGFFVGLFFGLVVTGLYIHHKANQRRRAEDLFRKLKEGSDYLRGVGYKRGIGIGKLFDSTFDDFN